MTGSGLPIIRTAPEHTTDSRTPAPASGTDQEAQETAQYALQDFGGTGNGESLSYWSARHPSGCPIPHTKENTMGLDDKIKNAAEKVVGKAKEGHGEATGDNTLKAEGQADQSKADLKGAGENIKDAFKK